MKIFITGGYGFIGSNFIINQINNSNNEILNFDNLSYAANIKNLTSIEKSKRYTFFKGSICNINSIEKSFKKFKPNVIIHFAAESHVDRSINDPFKFLNTNIIGTTNLLKVSLDYYKSLEKEFKQKFKFLHISTDEVFGSLGNKGYFDEDSPFLPNSPYSASKASSNHMVRAWNHTYGLPTLITNCSNNYGPYQFPEKLIPLVIANCVDEKSLPIYGDGLNIRDWLFVDDHCKAIEKVLFEGSLGETYNIGCNNEINNIEIVKTICKIMDKLKPREGSKKYSSLIKYVEDRPGHDFRYAINNSKIKKKLGWEPIESFDSGIKKTIRWYLDNEDWWREIQNKTYKQERLGLINE